MQRSVEATLTSFLGYFLPASQLPMLAQGGPREGRGSQWPRSVMCPSQSSPAAIPIPTDYTGHQGFGGIV